MQEPYRILHTSGDLAALEQMVNEATEQGYKPIGGPFYSASTVLKAGEWCQCMFREPGVEAIVARRLRSEVKLREQSK